MHEKNTWLARPRNISFCQKNKQTNQKKNKTAKKTCARYLILVSLYVQPLFIRGDRGKCLIQLNPIFWTDYGVKASQMRKWLSVIKCDPNWGRTNINGVIIARLIPPFWGNEEKKKARISFCACSPAHWSFFPRKQNYFHFFKHVKILPVHTTFQKPLKCQLPTYFSCTVVKKSFLVFSFPKSLRIRSSLPLLVVFSASG